MDFLTLSLTDLSKKIALGEITSEEVVTSYIERTNKVGNKINGYITTTFDEALKKARDIDLRIKKGEKVGQLAGVPYALKDNISTKGIRTTCSSKFLENFVPVYDATVYKKLNDADCVLLGKADMDEFAMGSSNENSSYNEVNNPWDTTRVPGGSSGASAALVASSQVPFALGSDTGGSIRMPASYCSVTGVKPSYGRVSRYGLVAFASSLDQIGPLARDVEDAAKILNVITGYDEKDSTSVKGKPEDFTSYLTEGIKGMKIGLDRTMFEKGCSKGIVEAVENAAKVFSSLGAQIVDISFKYTDHAIAAYYLVSSSEASSNLARFDGIRYGVRQEGENVDEIITASRSKGFGDEVKNRIMIGTYSLSAGYYDAYYNKALKVRRLIKEDYDRIFSTCDVILSPTTPATAYVRGEKNNDPISAYLSDIFTVTANLSGIPAMSIPGGFDEKGLPTGIQLSARGFNEEAMLKVGYNFQLATDFHKKKANL